MINIEAQGRNILVTGGSRGIGRAIALALAGEGANVAICGRTRETLEATAAEIRGHGVAAWPIVADVSRLEDIEACIAETTTAMGGVDILVNNAVTSLSAPFDEQTDEHWQYHIDVKLLAYIRFARAVLPAMEARGWGRIINIGGMTARIAAPLRVTNGIVNAGVANLTKQLAGRVATHGITINCVHPGMTETDRMTGNLKRRAADAGVDLAEITKRAAAEILLGRLIQPEDIAAAVLFLCAPRAGMITGQSIAVDGGSAQSINY